jgi:Tfp pilus assembly protein PilO
MKLSKEYLNQRYLLTTRRFATLAALLAVVGLLLIGFVLVPQVQSILGLVKDLQEANKDASSLAQKVEQLQNLPQSELLQAGTTINNVLPSKKPLLELLTSYNQIARESGVQFSDVSLSPGLIATESAETASSPSSSNPSGSKKRTAAPTRRKSTEYDQLDLSLKVSGSLPNINLFLQRVEQVAPLTTVTSMSLTEKVVRTENAGPSELYEAELVTTSYFFTQSVSATVRSPIPTLSTDQKQVISQISTFLIPQIDEQTAITGGGLQDLFGLSEEDLL